MKKILMGRGHYLATGHSGGLHLELLILFLMNFVCSMGSNSKQPIIFIDDVFIGMDTFSLSLVLGLKLYFTLSYTPSR